LFCSLEARLSAGFDEGFEYNRPTAKGGQAFAECCFKQPQVIQMTSLLATLQTHLVACTKVTCHIRPVTNWEFGGPHRSQPCQIRCFVSNYSIGQ